MRLNVKPVYEVYEISWSDLCNGMTQWIKEKFGKESDPIIYYDDEYFNAIYVVFNEEDVAYEQFLQEYHGNTFLLAEAIIRDLFQLEVETYSGVAIVRSYEDEEDYVHVFKYIG